MNTDVSRLVPHCALVLVLALGSGTAQRKEPDQGEMQKRWEAKQAEAWLKDGGWTTDLDAAKARAKEQNKVILAYFTRSYSP